MIEMQFYMKIKIARTYSGSYMSQREFEAYLQEKVIQSQRSCPNTPQQNAVSKHKS